MSAGRDALEAYPAALYAAVHTGVPGDIDFYRRVCTGAKRVLELGTGHGRVQAAVAADGAETIGIELHPGMADLARTRGLTVLEMDMTTFEAPGTYDRIIVPYCGMLVLLDRTSVVACLRRAREHLAPDGLLVFDSWNADPFHADVADEGPGQDEFALVKSVTAEGRRWDIFERSRWTPAERRIDATYLHVSGEASIEATIQQRYLVSDEIPGLLEDAGLTPLVFHGGFDQAVFEADDSELLIVTATASE